MSESQVIVGQPFLRLSLNPPPCSLHPLLLDLLLIVTKAPLHPVPPIRDFATAPCGLLSDAARGSLSEQE